MKAPEVDLGCFEVHALVDVGHRKFCRVTLADVGFTQFLQSMVLRGPSMAAHRQVGIGYLNGTSVVTTQRNL